MTALVTTAFLNYTLTLYYEHITDGFIRLKYIMLSELLSINNTLIIYELNLNFVIILYYYLIIIKIVFLSNNLVILHQFLVNMRSFTNFAASLNCFGSRLMIF